MKEAFAGMAPQETAVKSFSNLIASGMMEESHHLSIEEDLNFGRAKTILSKYQYGHDDLVMADVSISHLLNQITYTRKASSGNFNQSQEPL